MNELINDRPKNFTRFVQRSFTASCLEIIESLLLCGFFDQFFETNFFLTKMSHSQFFG